MGFEKKVDFLKKRKSWKKAGFAPASPVGDVVSPTIWGLQKWWVLIFSKLWKTKKGPKKMTPLRLDAMPAVISGLRLSWCIHASRRLRSIPIYDLPGLFRMAVI